MRLCELAGSQKPEKVDGISYFPELMGQKQQKHTSLYFEFHQDGGKQAIIKDNWKCIRLNLNFQEGPIVELYNLNDDVQEKNNLASQFPEKVTELVKLMEESRTENEHFKLYYSEISKLTKTESNIVK